jgi:hypothetical protein
MIFYLNRLGKRFKRLAKKNLQMGMIAVLHTWGQNLSLHPHLHCIVPGGGVDENGAWKNIKNDGKFLFPVKALSKVFRAKFCEKLKANLKDKFNENQENEYEKSGKVCGKNLG